MRDEDGFEYVDWQDSTTEVLAAVRRQLAEYSLELIERDTGSDSLAFKIVRSRATCRVSSANLDTVSAKVLLATAREMIAPRPTPEMVVPARHGKIKAFLMLCYRCLVWIKNHF